MTNFFSLIDNESLQDWKNDSETFNLSQKAWEALGGLKVINTTFIQEIPEINFFLQILKKSESNFSTQIEGTQNELEEVILEKKKNSKYGGKDLTETLNCILALNLGIKRLKDLPLSIRLMKEIHYTLMQHESKANPGEFRTVQNWIGSKDKKNARYVAPSIEKMQDLLGKLEKFMHNKTIDPLIKIAITHYQFEAIHPFIDGNGRLGRIMIDLQFLENDILDRPLYLWSFFEKNVKSYELNLAEVSKTKKFKGWIDFFLQGIIETCKKRLLKIEKFLVLKKEYQQKTREIGKNSEKILSLLWEKAFINAKQVSEKLNISFSTALVILKKMEETKILKTWDDKKRNRVYLCFEYIKLFREF